MNFHKYNTSNLVVLFFLISSVVSAQDLKIQVGQSVDNSTTKTKAGSITATFPRDTIPNSESIQGFIEVGLNFPDNTIKSYSVSVFAEKHRNNLINKEQDVTQFGGQIMFHLWENSEFFLLKNYKVKFLGTAKYSNDRIAKTDGGQYLLHFNLASKGVGGNFGDALLNIENFYPRDEYKNYENNPDIENPDSSKRFTSDYIQFSSSHTFGVEYMSNEDLVLGNMVYSLNIYPLSGLIYRVFKQYRMLQFSFGIDHRFQINSKNTELFVGNLLTASAGVNFLINEKKGYQLGLKYAYQEGGNPLKGLADQTFSQLTLTAKFVLDK
ncbi:hypothetical protein [Aquimarina megaterium]|uniref:hypothetical protein n=1 Tax=Aquimarina megaterium TaxID=1443666 RepID=UPI000470921B|nr:hypothetical protein [Aquimarina megaterium]